MKKSSAQHDDQKNETQAESYHPVGIFKLLCAVLRLDDSGESGVKWLQNYTVEKSNKVLRVVDTLTDQERRVIILRFGLTDADDLTLQSIGDEFELTRERIRQLQNRALRKLRHPTRIRKLEPLVLGLGLHPAKKKFKNKAEFEAHLTEALADIFLGEKIPLDVTNMATGEILIPANHKITKTQLCKVAEKYMYIELNPSPLRIKIMGVIDSYRNLDPDFFSS